VCRAGCAAYPQRDFALRDILPLIYSGLGREAPTSETVDATFFARIYAMIEESSSRWFSELELKAFWAPMIKEVQRMRGVTVPNVIDVDVEMGRDDEGSDWELGSGVDSGEDEGEMGDTQEGETGGEQGEGDGAQGEA